MPSAERLLQYAVTAFLPYCNEPVLFQKPADLVPRENRSLPNRDFDLRHEHLVVEPT
jgi:hypothetical protein